MAKDKTKQPTLKTMTVRELMRREKALEKKRPSIRVEKQGIDLNAFADYEYFIEWDRLDDKEKMLEWVMHLSEKAWCTSRLIRQLIQVSCDHHKLNIWVNA